MPVSATKAASERRTRPNLMSRRERTRKEGKCQLCEKKTPIKDQYTVVNDLDEGVATKRKNAGAKGNETSSHYCGECADKRVTQKEAWINSVRNADAKPKAKKGKKGAKGKAKAKAKKATKKAVKKVKKVAKKGKAKKGGKAPF